jgi:hypothetical protein
MNDLAGFKDKIAAMLAQNLLLQEQLAAFWGISASTTEILPLEMHAGLLLIQMLTTQLIVVETVA